MASKHIPVVARTPQQRRTKKRSEFVRGGFTNLREFLVKPARGFGGPAAGFLPRLSDEERQFFVLVNEGDTQEVYQFVKSRPTLNLNCRDYMGSSALIVAVKNEDVDMVDFLLTFRQVYTKDALMHAISTGNLEIIKLLLNEQREVNKNIGHVEHAEADFSSDMTPLILAAQTNNYEVVRHLLEQGYTIEKPHLPNCRCPEKCKTMLQSETLCASKARLNAYRALSSPSYMCQATSDPILTCFQLCRELRVCAGIEREFKKEYLDLAEQCSNFGAELIGLCRSSEEVEMVLSRREGADEGLSDSTIYPRVVLAVETEQKRFIAHPNCQQVLRAAWLGDWQDWKRLTFWSKVLRIFPRMVILPLMALIYLLVPSLRFTGSWRYPFNKFLSFAASYLIFLTLLFTQNYLEASKVAKRGPPSTGLEGILVCYVFGLLWQELKQVWSEGFSSYIRQGWNKYDIFMIATFLLTFGCWFWAYIDVRLNGNEFLPRNMWYHLDPTLIGEGCAAVATILAFGRLMYFLQVGESLGPMQVSISHMFKDMANFLVILVVVMFSFAIGLYKLYHHYKKQVRTIDGVSKYQSPIFSTFKETINTLFWALFALIPHTSSDVVVQEHYVTIGNKTVAVINKHKFTEALGYTLFGVYHVASIVVLLNLLIAMMSTSFMNVVENEDMEWKFARTQVWISYFDNGGTLPPPFNLIPSPKSIARLFIWMGKFVMGRDEAQFSCKDCCYIDKEDEKMLLVQNENYQILMSQLVQRYLVARDKKSGSGPVTMTEMEQLQQEIGEVQNQLKKVVRYVSLGRRSSVFHQGGSLVSVRPQDSVHQVPSFTVPPRPHFSTDGSDEVLTDARQRRPPTMRLMTPQGARERLATVLTDANSPFA